MNPDDFQRNLFKILVPVFWILLSAYSWEQAQKKRRRPWPWFLAALLLNPVIVLLILYFMPQGKFTPEKHQLERASKRWPAIVAISASIIILIASALYWVGARHEKCETAISRFDADINQTTDVMKAIGSVRRGSGRSTIEEYIQMYQSLEPRVAEARTILARLRTEIPRCGDFQSKVGNFGLILDNFDQRFILLSKEIEVAKSIGSSPANEHEKRWRSELVPLVDQEESLKKQLESIK